ncbi:hypothetical protein [Hymenobacter volaticus]|uniref:Lipoprotein n=1 Tax=Hymenobacter volaticus TaxID=2932254 RepID=A0ABY4G7W8_9BACT|nr:hypothetical protein [Hymenobacter volaticus]UOQ66998.1 hypothetical protein MUN86_03555 [Hymenobacter volaticus]
MKKLLFVLPVAAAFSLASCGDNKTAETTTTTETPTTSTAATGDMDAQYRTRAQRIADKMAADMKITDTAMVSRIRTTYYTRAQRLGELRTKYASDTAGMAADMRSAYSETDNEFKGYLPAESYTAYETSRPTYYEEDYMDDASAPAETDNTASASTETGSSSDGEGGKLKVKADGDIKIKDAEGNKAKIDGDDGTVKLKPENGKDVKIK